MTNEELERLRQDAERAKRRGQWAEYRRLRKVYLLAQAKYYEREQR